MMGTSLKSLFVIFLVVLLDAVVYFALLQSEIAEWGSTQSELNMTMIGDSEKEKITSTRAITINAPKEIVWQWLMQLGADRAGFYSYDFIELALGYETRFPNMQSPNFDSLKVGDLVRGSINEAKSIIPYNFEVLMLIPEETFVLSHWGSFLITDIDETQSRLVIRTQEPVKTERFGYIKHSLALPFHFIMERRTLYGIKMKAENQLEQGFSHFKDQIWFVSIVMTWFMIFILSFILKKVKRRVLISASLGCIWLITLFILPPLPIFSVSFLVVVGLFLILALKHSFMAAKQT